MIFVYIECTVIKSFLGKECRYCRFQQVAIIILSGLVTMGSRLPLGCPCRAGLRRPALRLCLGVYSSVRRFRDLRVGAGVLSLRVDPGCILLRLCVRLDDNSLGWIVLCLRVELGRVGVCVYRVGLADDLGCLAWDLDGLSLDISFRDLAI